jgi:exodeoxyribonuclease V
MPDGIMAITDPAAAPLSPEQKAAVADIKEFLSDSTRRVFSVHGLAGVGKSHLLGRIARSSLDPLVAAPTGKAASLLRERFDVPAQTIHSLFHRLKSETQRADGRRDLAFEPRRRDGSMAGKILLIDEASMGTDQLRDQLLDTGVRIIAFGDEGQLPPVKGAPGFPVADFTLTQIHRQAADSPIIRQAHAVRFGGDYQSDGDAFRVVGRGTHDHLREARVVLCWTNNKRRFLNQLARRVTTQGEIPGRAAPDGSFDPRREFPRQWEPVVVTRNAPRHGYWNGDVEMLGADLRPGDKTVSLWWVSESGSSAGEVELPLASFEGMPSVGGVAGGLELAFGYVRTVHAAQGSEWRNVVLVDEFPRHDPERAKWVYSGITRASERIVIVNRSYR